MDPSRDGPPRPGHRSPRELNSYRSQRARRCVREGFRNPSPVFVLHPTYWETTELALSSQTAIEHLSLPYDPATRRLFGVPVTTSNAQAAGVGHVLASDAVALDTDTRGVDVQWSENATADSFGKNLVFARCESRYATSVFSPLGVVSLDLTA